MKFLRLLTGKIILFYYFLLIFLKIYFVDRYKRKVHSVHIFDSTKPTWLNITLIKEDLNVWSQINDFGLKTNIAKIVNYKTKDLFLNELMELENSLSSVAELVTKPNNLNNVDSSTIQFKVTENVRNFIEVIH